MRVNALEGALLDFWVAKSSNLKLRPAISGTDDAQFEEIGFWHPDTYHPSSNWSQGGPIVSDEWYSIEDALLEWFGPNWPFIKTISDSPLKWFMRAYVKCKFGDEVEEVDHIALCRLPSDELNRAKCSRHFGGLL